jgi:hypothetical protein
VLEATTRRRRVSPEQKTAPNGAGTGAIERYCKSFHCYENSFPELLGLHLSVANLTYSLFGVGTLYVTINYPRVYRSSLPLEIVIPSSCSSHASPYFHL